MEQQDNFFTIIGIPGSRSKEVFNFLKDKWKGDKEVYFLLDSGNHLNAPYHEFLNSLSAVAKTGTYIRGTHISQLALFWSRLHTVIERELVPELEAGRKVVMEGFAGTILPYALTGVSDTSLRNKLTKLHQTFNEVAVDGSQVPQPKYLWIKVTEETAMRNLGSDVVKLPPDMDPSDYLNSLDRNFAEYKNFPGQTVIEIDGNRPVSEVAAEVEKYLF